jgi:hypothetical protein
MNKNTSYENDIRIIIPKDKIQENMKQESFFIKLLKKLYIL